MCVSVGQFCMRIIGTKPHTSDSAEANTSSRMSRTYKVFQLSEHAGLGLAPSMPCILLVSCVFWVDPNAKVE